MSEVLVSVIIPVYNEFRTFNQVLERVRKAPLPEGCTKEIIVIDDGSTDGTTQIVDGQVRAGIVRGHYSARNAGKGAAIRIGIALSSGDIILIQDGDLEYDPNDYRRLVEPIVNGDADVVYGSRFLGGPHRIHLFWHYVGNKLLTLLSDMVTNLNLSDVWTCYKALRRDVILGLNLKENRFGFEQEITIKIARGGWSVYETPISYYGRTYAEGKKITWKDGARALWCIVRYGFFSGPDRSPRPPETE